MLRRTDIPSIQILMEVDFATAEHRVHGRFKHTLGELVKHRPVAEKLE